MSVNFTKATEFILLQITVIHNFIYFFSPLEIYMTPYCSRRAAWNVVVNMYIIVVIKYKLKYLYKKNMNVVCSV